MSIEKRLEEMAVRFREMYPPGTRLLLLHMDDTLHPMPSGIRGTVESIDDQCQITTVWDNGSVRRLQPDNDSFRKLTDKEYIIKPRMHFMSVVLPAPFSPNNPMISPLGSVKLTCERAGFPEYVFVTFLISIIRITSIRFATDQVTNTLLVLQAYK